MEKQFEGISTKEAKNDIFNATYEGGLGHPQKGKFKVWATNLTGNGKINGGGWVESFNRREDAENCKKTIEVINSNHEPKIEE